MGSLSSDIAAEPVRWTREEVRKHLGDEADEFDALIEDETVSVPALHRALRQRGVNISLRGLYYWRNNQ